MKYEEDIRKPYFYVTLVYKFLIGMVLQVLIGIAVPHMYDIFGNYKVEFIIFALLMAVVTVAMQFVLRAARRDRKIILDACSES